MRALTYTLILSAFVFSQHLYAQVPVNDLCEDAIEIVCGESYFGNISTATIGPPDCISNNDVWFTLVGDGNFYSFDFLNLSIDNTVFFVFEDDCNSFNLTNCIVFGLSNNCLLYTSPSPRDRG